MLEVACQTVSRAMAISLVEFDVDDAVRFVLDERASLPIRAIRLYELQLAILRCQRPKLARAGPGKERLDLSGGKEAVSGSG